MEMGLEITAQGREGGWVSLNPGELRAKGWLLLESRQGIGISWKLKEFGECLRWRQQQENQVSCALRGSASPLWHPGTISQNHPRCQHKSNTLSLHPGGSWFGRTSWENWAHWSPRCSREAWPRWPSWDSWSSCEYSQFGQAQVCSCIPPAWKMPLASALSVLECLTADKTRFMVIMEW